MMNTKFQLLVLLIFSLSLGLLSSCDKENIDDEMISDEQFPVDTIICDINFDLELGIGGIPLETISIVNLSGGTAPYTYIWNTGDSTDVIVAETVGTYTVTVTDDNNCTHVDSVEVLLNTDPCDSLMVEINVVDTFMMSILTAAGVEGVSPYTYEWSTGEMGEEIVVSSSGMYSVTVTDAESCTAIDSAQVDIDPCMDFTMFINFNQDTVGSMQDFLVAIPSGGTLPYNYLWSNGETAQDIEVTNMPGVYDVTVTDVQGCILQESYTVP